jgi:hypothetical protein
VSPGPRSSQSANPTQAPGQAAAKSRPPTSSQDRLLRSLLDSSTLGPKGRQRERSVGSATMDLAGWATSSQRSDRFARSLPRSSKRASLARYFQRAGDDSCSVPLFAGQALLARTSIPRDSSQSSDQATSNPDLAASVRAWLIPLTPETHGSTDAPGTAPSFCQFPESRRTITPRIKMSSGPFGIDSRDQRMPLSCRNFPRRPD